MTAADRWLQGKRETSKQAYAHHCVDATRRRITELSPTDIMLYCQINNKESLNFIWDILNSQNPISRQNRPNFATAIANPLAIPQGKPIAQGRPLPYQNAWYSLPRNSAESATIFGLFTCTAVIAYRGDSDIFVYHAPSGEVRVNEIDALNRMARQTGEIGHVIYIIPEEGLLDTYKSQIEAIECAGFDVCIITNTSRINGVSVTGRLDLYIF